MPDEEEEDNAIAQAYDQGVADLYEWCSETVKEWHDLKIVNDSQMLWLKELLHEMEKRAYYTFKDTSL